MKKALTLLLLGSMIFAPIGQITYAADNSAAAAQTVQKTRLEELEEKEKNETLTENEKKELDYLKKENETKEKIDILEKKEKEDETTFSETDKKELAALKVNLAKDRFAHLEWKDSIRIIGDDEKTELEAFRKAQKKARYEELKAKGKLEGGDIQEFEKLKKLFESPVQVLSDTVSPVPGKDWDKKPVVKRDRLTETEAVKESSKKEEEVFSDKKPCTADWYAETVHDPDLPNAEGIVYRVNNIDQGILEIHSKQETSGLVNWTAALATSRKLKNGKLYIEFADPNWRPIKESFAILKMDKDEKESPFTEAADARDSKNKKELYAKENYISDYKAVWNEKDGVNTLTIDLGNMSGNSSLAFELKGYYSHSLENVLKEYSLTGDYSEAVKENVKYSSEFINPKDGNNNARTWLSAAFTADIENCSETLVTRENSSNKTSRLSGSKGIPKTSAYTAPLLLPEMILLGTGAYIILKKKRK